MHGFDEEEYASNDNIKVSKSPYKVQKFKVDNKRDIEDSMKIDKLVNGYSRSRPPLVKQLTGSGYSDNSCK
jgi:hypothetical protein